VASHRVRPVRTALAGVLVAALAAGAVAVVSAPGLAAPKPTLAQVQAQLNSLNNQAEVAQEKANQTQIAVASAVQVLAGARAKVAASQARLAAARSQVGQLASALYRGGSMDPSMQLFLADDPAQYLEQMSALAGVQSRQTNILRIAAGAQLRLAQDERAVSQQLDIVRALNDAAAADYAQVKAAAASEAALLSSLQAAQRAALLRAAALARQQAIAQAKALALAQAQAAAAAQAAADAAAAARRKAIKGTKPAHHPPATHHSPNPPATGGGGSSSIGARVVAYALAQVGDAYVWGAAGPNAFDCSGLTMRAYQQVGISLPHSSAAQAHDGRAISVADLRPGDLVFYYWPIHHVGIYIGGGMIVNAENPGVGVTITGLYSMPYSGAVRPY
jgi:peptidoglycan DL-endopeptidase CwlO